MGLHIQAVVNCFKQVDNLKLLIGLVLCEILITISFQTCIELIIAIGRQMTLLELNRPWDFAK